MTMTFPSEEDDELIIIEDEDLDFLPLTKEEAKALLNEFRFSFIHYENPIAWQVINKMMRFVDET